MKRSVLHIVVGGEDPLASGIRKEHEENEEVNVRWLELPAGGADYSKLLDAIFEADSIIVWSTSGKP